MKTAKRKRLKLDGGIENIELVEEEPKKKHISEQIKPAIGTEIGFSVVVPTVGGVLLGVYLDNKLNTAPKLTLSFLFLGVIIGFVNIFRIINDNVKK